MDEGPCKRSSIVYGHWDRFRAASTADRIAHNKEGDMRIHAGKVMGGLAVPALTLLAAVRLLSLPAAGAPPLFGPSVAGAAVAASGGTTTPGTNTPTATAVACGMGSWNER